MSSFSTFTFSACLAGAALFGLAVTGSAGSTTLEHRTAVVVGGPAAGAAPLTALQEDSNGWW
ncbi:hypothetical protein [Streptomyces sp900116325]|uniref:hypothetical protein n=1 Tax=Streptomyces sp. 900116325 TaxID=3154295 RepID=UPI003408C587